MRQPHNQYARTLDALIEQADGRSMRRLAKNWKYDNVPTTRRASMTKFLRESWRVDFWSLVPVLRVSQLREACRSLNISCTGLREDLRLRLLAEYRMDHLDLGPPPRCALTDNSVITEPTKGVRNLLFSVPGCGKTRVPHPFIEKLSRSSSPDEINSWAAEAMWKRLGRKREGNS